MKRGPYADVYEAFEGAAVDLGYVRRAYPTWRAEQPDDARADGLINAFAMQFGVVLEQVGDEWFWSTPDHEVYAAP
jgi:hypothetical protein